MSALPPPVTPCDPLHERIVEQMALGVSTQSYEQSLEELPAELDSRTTSKSAVSRRFVAKTQKEVDA